MKASQFVELLRKVVREEVKSVVREEIKSLKSVLINENITTIKPKQKPIAKRPYTAPPARKQAPVSFSGPLADILNETARSMQHAPMEDEWPEMNGRMFDAEDAPAVGLQSMMSMVDSELETPSLMARQAAMTGDPTAALMKDYSELLQKADALAQSNRG